MPKVGGKHYPYTKKGKAAAKKAAKKNPLNTVKRRAGLKKPLVKKSGGY